MGPDQAVPVRVPQLAIAALGMELDPGLALGLFDQLRQLRGQLGADALVAHPLLVVPVQLARVGGLDLEAGPPELRHPPRDPARSAMLRLAPAPPLRQVRTP